MAAREAAMCKEVKKEVKQVKKEVKQVKKEVNDFDVDYKKEKTVFNPRGGTKEE